MNLLRSNIYNDYSGNVLATVEVINTKSKKNVPHSPVASSKFLKNVSQIFELMLLPYVILLK